MPTPVSFIVPVYNVLAYLDECIASLVTASREGDEIILVNDGSTDASGARCDDWQRRHPTLISVIHQDNGGLSVARNTGLASARNPYIYFLDSDDVLCSEHFDLIRSELATHSPDLLTCDALIWVDGTPLSQAKRVTHSLHVGVNTDIDTVLQATFRDDFLATAARVYRAELLNELGPDVFPPGKCYEDNATIPPLLLRARKVVYLPTTIYRYRIRAGSITQSHSWGRCVDQAVSFTSFFAAWQASPSHNSETERTANAIAFKHLVMAVRNASRTKNCTARKLLELIDMAMARLTLSSAALLAALEETPGARKLKRHARGILRRRRLYVASRLVAARFRHLATIARKG
ncbi:MAG: glycosyltransferase [Aquabacterium sp.]